MPISQWQPKRGTEIENRPFGLIALFGGQRAEGKLVDYLNKGQMVCVSGEMGIREHDGKTYITMRVENVTLCGGRNDAPQAPQKPAQNQYAQQSNGGGVAMDDDIPFAQISKYIY